MLHLNGFSFAGAPLVVERLVSNPVTEVTISPFDQAGPGQAYGANVFAKHPQPDLSQTGSNTKAVLTQILGRRYDSSLRLLNLSALKQDPDLQQLGVFANPATESKFFPVLMKICDEVWETPAKKNESVESVTISNNHLANVLDITTLATTFPSLRNLDLSSNLISDFEGLKYWRWKFRDLEHLVLSNNPIESALDFKKTITKWYPKLLQLNGVEVRTKKDIQKQQNPIPVLSPYFQDEADIGAKFVTDFFPLFDAGRDTALRNFYDANSSFSVSVNTHAKRVQREESHSSNWDQYIKKSRNLLKITHLPARSSRLYRGAQIQTAWEQMPRTKHPSLSQHPSDWLIECHPLPGLPDSKGEAGSGGVGGLIIMVHGNFEETHPQTGKTLDRRSFDRTFVLGPGAGVGGIRVVSDILVLRAPGGSEAWGVSSTYQDSSSSTTTAITTEARIPHPEVQPGSGIGEPAPGKSDVQLQQEVLAIELSFKTSMKLEWAAKCLIENGWDMQKALVNFQELVNKEHIPPEAFLNVTKG
jgi:nuclear RNA export factor